MKKNYTTLARMVPVVIILALAAACSSELTYQEAMRKNRTKIEDIQKLGDAQFLVDARSYNILEKKMAELAMTSGYAADIVNMAKGNLDDHKELEDELEELARKEKIKLPASMDERHLSVYNSLAGLDRAEFDKQYLRTLKQVNEENTNRYLDMATEAHDADVRAFAARHLDVFRSHARKIGDVDQILLSTY